MLVHPVTLSKDFKELEILGFSDLHTGSPDFDRPLFEKYVKYVLDEPNRYCFLNGDLIDNATKFSVSDIYEADIVSPRNQIIETVTMLKPLAEAGRILGETEGNHEKRSSRDVGISPAECIADKLGIPFWGPEALLKIRFGQNKHFRPAYYTFYVTHGYGGGRLKGGKANNLDRLKNIVIADVYMMGHTHGQMCFPGMVYEPDQRNDVINERITWFVNSGSFLDRGSGYAASFGYEPQPKGCPIICLDGWNRKITVVQGKI